MCTTENCQLTRTTAMFEISFSQNVNSSTWLLLSMLAVFLTVCLGTRFILVPLFYKRNLPPGPWCLPVVGCLRYIKANSHLKLTQLGKKFGSIYQIFLGSHRVVVVSDPRLVREAFKQSVFSGRPDTSLTRLMEGRGIINTGGKLWYEQRTFLHSVLRDFGARNMGPNSSALETNIQNQASELLASLEATNGAKLYIRPVIARAVSNVIGTLLMSVTFRESDPGFKRLLYLIEDGFKHLTVAAPVNFMPILKHLPFLRGAYKKIQSNKRETDAYFAYVARRHKETLDPENIRDFVDRFFMKQAEVRRQNKEAFFSDEQLHQVMGDVFSAGLETVTSTLEWSVLFLVRHKDIQKRIQEEIDEIVGTERRPELSDMPYMPYVEAFSLEVLRRANVIPLGNAHATTEDTKLGGYFIPKGTHILPNLWSIHMDPKLWDSPEEFRPERFLVDGAVVKPLHFMPFSVGRRMCVGDVLSKMEVFLFLTGILQKFDLEIPYSEDLPNLDDVESYISLTAKPFNVCVFPREPKIELS